MTIIERALVVIAFCQVVLAFNSVWETVGGIVRRGAGGEGR